MDKEQIREAYEFKNLFYPYNFKAQREFNDNEKIEIIHWCYKNFQGRWGWKVGIFTGPIIWITIEDKSDAALMSLN